MRTYDIEDGEFLVRVHSQEFASDSFKPYGISEGRFDPVADKNGNGFSVMYLGTHYIDAIAETIMRKNENGARHFNIDQIEKKEITTLLVSKNIHLLDLSSIKALEPLLAGGKQNYSKLRNFAKLVLSDKRFDEVQGFIWSGHQRGIAGARVMVLFGNRIEPSTLIPTHTESLLYRTGYNKLQDAANALGCVIPEYVRKVRRLEASSRLKK
ncbi:RES domain-containing protein [Vibrio sp. HN007]|uniref:RES domain-containing protein n=1 Tax=Vibrio iocasae TaxID=3098914 RepID=UPI0035D52B0D